MSLLNPEMVYSRTGAGIAGKILAVQPAKEKKSA
jgi:hypothetical protein